MRKQYHARRVGQDIQIWDVHKLIRASLDPDIRDVAVADIPEIDENWWYQEPGVVPTARSIAQHVELVS